MQSLLRRAAELRDGEIYRRDMLFLSASRLISVTGTTVSYVAVVTVVYERSAHSGAWVAVTLVLMFASGAAAAPWPGGLGDRADRRRVLESGRRARVIPTRRPTQRWSRRYGVSLRSRDSSGRRRVRLLRRDAVDARRASSSS